MRKFLKEPLVQFILLGFVLFVGHGIWTARSGGGDKVIHISTDTVERLKTIYAGEQSRQPSADDTAALIAAYIEEEALSREAERLGLGEDDTIIRRRLAQKMRFMTENISQINPPDDQVLQDWYAGNLDKFKEPRRISFQHIYFSPDENSGFEKEARNALEVAQNGEDWQALGDPFIMSRSYTRLSQTDITRAFGQNFANNIMDETPGEWFGPIESAFGLHIVRITERVVENQPTFDQAKGKILTAYQDEKQRAENAEKIKAIINRYDVRIEEAR